MRIRDLRFFNDRYVYGERPDYLIELVAFGIIVIVATLSLASLQPANAAVYVRGGAFYGPTATVKHVGYTRVTPWGVKHVGYTRVWR